MKNMKIDANGTEIRVMGDVVNEDAYKIVNIDATVIAQSPKLAEYIEKMRENIADDCSIEKDCVNIKATTEEHLGFTGKGEGISAHAVCLIENAENGIAG